MASLTSRSGDKDRGANGVGAEAQLELWIARLRNSL
jgi:hypothetical protein